MEPTNALSVEVVISVNETNTLFMISMLLEANEFEHHMPCASHPSW